MSLRIMSRVWSQSRHRGERLLLLLALADYADDQGRAWPSVPVLARKARIDERSVYRIVRELVKSGEVVVRPGGGRGNRNAYQITLPDVTNPDARSVFPGQGIDENPDRVSGETLTLGASASIYRIRHKIRHVRSNRKKTTLPADFGLTDERRQMLECLSLDPEAFFGHFVDQASAGGYRYANWDAALRAWARNESRDPRSRFRVAPPVARPRGRTFDEQLAARLAAMAAEEAAR